VTTNISNPQDFGNFLGRENQMKTRPKTDLGRDFHYDMLEGRSSRNRSRSVCIAKQYICKSQKFRCPWGGFGAVWGGFGAVWGGVFYYDRPQGGAARNLNAFVCKAKTKVYQTTGFQ